MFGTICLYIFYALCAWFCYWVLKTYLHMNKREKEGVVWMNRFPQISDTIRIIMANTRDPSKIPIYPSLTHYFGEELPAKIGMWLFGSPSVIFNRVSCLNELYVKKNAYFTKHEQER